MFCVSGLFIYQRDSRKLVLRRCYRNDNIYDSDVANTNDAYEEQMWRHACAHPKDEVRAIGRHVVHYRPVADMFFFLLANGDDVMLASAVLATWIDVTMYVYGGSYDCRSLLRDPMRLYLVLDELIDRGIVLEADAEIIQGNVLRVLPQSTLAEKTATTLSTFIQVEDDRTTHQ